MTVIFLLCRARATDNVYVYTYVVKIGIFSCSLCAENSIEVAPAVIDLHVHMVAYREKKDVEQNKLDAAHTHTHSNTVKQIKNSSWSHFSVSVCIQSQRHYDTKFQFYSYCYSL